MYTRCTDRATRFAHIDYVLRGIKNGDKFSPTKYIHAFDGKGFLEAVRTEKQWLDNDKVAFVAVVRASIFGRAGITAPSNVNVIIQFWDEAVDILNGDATLVIDICNETSRDYYSDDRCYGFPPRRRSDGTPIRPWRRTERDSMDRNPYTGEAYEHKMLNCTTNAVYKEHRPYVLWWEPTLKPSYRY